MLPVCCSIFFKIPLKTFKYLLKSSGLLKEMYEARKEMDEGGEI